MSQNFRDSVTKEQSLMVTVQKSVSFRKTDCPVQFFIVKRGDSQRLGSSIKSGTAAARDQHPKKFIRGVTPSTVSEWHPIRTP